MSVKEAVKSQQKSNSVSRAFIELEDPDSFYDSTEFFVRRLVNGPFEFGTVTLSEQVGGGEDEGEIHYMNYQVDIAMHANLGLVVCGLLFTPSKDEIAMILEDLERQREKLMAKLAENRDLSEQVPPVGIFVAMPKGSEPRLWDENKAYLCGPGKVGGLEVELMRCMQKTARDADMEDYQYWPRVVAAMRSEGVYTALEWLINYGEI